MEPTSLPQFRDVPWRWIAYGASVIVVGAVAFGFLHEVELKQDVQCEIVSPSDVKVQGLSGLVSSVYVHPGERVHQGMPLFSVQRDLSLASDGRRRPEFDEQMRDEQIRMIDLQYEQRRAQLAAQLDASNGTVAIRHAEALALDEQIAQNRQLVSEAQQKLGRLQSVSDYVTADRIEQASADTHQMKISVAQGLARRQQLEGEIVALRSAQGNLAAQLKENDARHAREIQDIRMRFEQARQDATISAPKSGVVAFSNLVAGRTLDAADVALVIATDDRGALRAALRIPSRRRGFVRTGQTVRLKFDAFPYVKFGTYDARIDAISPTTIQSGMSAVPVSPTAPRESGDGDFMAWAALRGRTFDYGKQRFDILPGMRATASIVVERRTIAEWVLEPLFRTLRG
ncbi:HlyD family efflux transporter periplasmic adaptor subunit [Paraburkholderia sp. Tr-20389]|uniref:HlyD family efflux transporter periplasmic adaptor subunit n=1 Tax=Paraburkholderia sp. Tr-20389 TaxID=2703903 RepID=UPI00198148E3|nr:HlyD family efflux transporter periplasmic adaptor subunit [Paraburkholderia sp. Tr-20389]MBN3757395.1 HlyD family efflux transporter periplasmic adaptor subunit [Paraburkholderia sp. Tr-20389]